MSVNMLKLTTFKNIANIQS